MGARHSVCIRNNLAWNPYRTSTVVLSNSTCSYLWFVLFISSTGKHKCLVVLKNYRASTVDHRETSPCKPFLRPGSQLIMIVVEPAVCHYLSGVRFFLTAHLGVHNDCGQFANVSSLQGRYERNIIIVPDRRQAFDNTMELSQWTKEPYNERFQ